MSPAFLSGESGAFAPVGRPRAALCTCLGSPELVTASTLLISHCSLSRPLAPDGSSQPAHPPHLCLVRQEGITAARNTQPTPAFSWRCDSQM